MDDRIQAEYPHRTRLGLTHTQQVTNQRGLSRAIAADQSEDATLRNLQ
jgi:hypothetical protein